MSICSKIIVMSDIHLTKTGEKIIDLNPRKKLEAALKHAVEAHPDAKQIVFTGDLAHDGELKQYLILKDILKTVKIPITFMMGNHDKREAFSEVFPDVQFDDHGFLQSTLSLDSYRLIFLDTLNYLGVGTEKHKGFLCEHRLSWLDKQLSRDIEKRVILFMHHPAFCVGFRAMDKIRLKNSEDLFLTIDKYKNVVQIISGHIHRTISGNYNGYSFSIFKSTCHQMPSMFESENVKLSAKETPAYGLLLLMNDSIIVHSEDFELAAEKKHVFQNYSSRNAKKSEKS